MSMGEASLLLERYRRKTVTAEFHSDCKKMRQGVAAFSAQGMMTCSLQPTKSGRAGSCDQMYLNSGRAFAGQSLGNNSSIIRKQ